MKEYLTSEGFINFKDINIVDSKTSILKSDRNSTGRANTHEMDRHSCDSA